MAEGVAACFVDERGVLFVLLGGAHHLRLSRQREPPWFGGGGGAGTCLVTAIPSDVTPTHGSFFLSFRCFLPITQFFSTTNLLLLLLLFSVMLSSSPRGCFLSPIQFRAASVSDLC